MPRQFGSSNEQQYTSAPAVGVAGSSYYNTTDTRRYISDGVAWRDAGANDGPFLAPVRLVTGNHGLTGLAAIDGVTPIAGDRIGAFFQTTGSQNGVYIAASGAWARAGDANTSASLAKGTRVWSTEGTNNAFKEWKQINAFATLGTDTALFRIHNQIDIASSSLAYPPPLANGHLIWDSGAEMIRIWTGASWGFVHGVINCTSTTRPTFPVDRDIIYETDTGSAYIRVGSAWLPFGANNLNLPMLPPVKCRDAGANLTLSGTQTIDGIAVVAGDRVLACNQTTGSENGIYVVAAGAWSRATDCPAGAGQPFGTQVLVLQGNFFRMLTYTQTEPTPASNPPKWRVYTSVDTVNAFSFPGPMNAGHMMFNGSQKTIVVWNGFGWVNCGQPQICTSTTRPTYPGDEMLIYETDTGNAMMFYSGAWRNYGTEVSIASSTPAAGQGFDLWVDTSVSSALNANDSGWIAFSGVPAGFTLVGGSVPGYRKLSGVVYLRGVVQNTTTGALTTAWTLPVGFRPVETFYQTVNANTTTLQSVGVSSSGQVQFYQSGATTAWMTFGGLSFIADN